jgi:high-affinity nickel-transport protein
LPAAAHPGRARLAGLFGLLAGLNLIAWAWAGLAFAHRPMLLGMALVAWLFGLRHAFDADHIAAIDNVVRKLMQAGQRPYLAGLHFSLGHSTIVVMASLLVATLADAATARGPLARLERLGAVFGASVSAVTLLLFAAANLMVLVQARRPTGDADGGLGGGLGGGLLARLLRPVFALVSRSWHMYPVGFLFGLGFDTATEVGLLGISASQAVRGMPAAQLLVFPALFTAAMALADSADSVLMVGAYGWAFVEPGRKRRYNLAITATSVAVATVIGLVELGNLAADRLRLSGGFWSWLEIVGADMGAFGGVIAALFAAMWGASLLRSRLRSAARPVQSP